MLLILISFMTVLPVTFKLIQTGPLNGFNMGFLLLPLLLPLSMSPIFGFLAFLNYEKYFQWVKKILIGTYGIIAVLSLGFALAAPVFSIILLIILIPLILSIKITAGRFRTLFSS